MKNTFRTAAVGGFNRQDVMDYITKTAAETAETIRVLEQERDDYANAAAEKESLAAEAAMLREKLEAITAALESERSDRQRLSGADQAKLALEKQVAELESQAAEYRDLKEHIAQVELDARKLSEELLSQAERQSAALMEQAKKNAEEVVAKANEEAASVRRALSAQVQMVSGEYAQLLNDFDTEKSNVTSELRKMDVSFSQLPLAFNKMSAELKQLEQQSKE